MSKIQLTNVTKHYGKVVAVDRLSLEIREGEFLTLLGPSGCGKTTTLRMIAGLEEPTEGEISSNGTVFHSREKGVYLPPEKRNLGFMFQSYALWPHMDVMRNISLGLESKKIPAPEITARIADVLEKVQLQGYESRYPSELSGGQQQRVALARMIAAKSDIFLMDEPLSNLDALLRVDMRSELKHLHKELGSTSVYVTHDQVEALTLSDRIVVMNNGRIMQCDTPERIYKKPQNLFVAKFVGSPAINLISGIVEKFGVRRRFTSPEITVDISELAGFPATAEGQELLLAVRAEDLSVAPVSQKENAVSCSVYAVLPSGSETIITAKRGETELAIKVPGFYKVNMDETINVVLTPERLSFYDPVSQELVY